MVASSPQASQAPEFPYWPFNCLSFYAQMLRDFGGYAQAVSRSTDAMEAARAEGDFGVRLFGDLMQGYYNLALAPWTAMAAMMAERTSEAAAAPPPAAETLPIRTVRGRPH
jgi:hypothetical protein